MAIARIPYKNTVLRETEDIRACLGKIGVDYENWHSSYDVSPDASDDEILQAYSAEIERLKQKNGYVAADVISLEPDTPNLQELLDKFNREHWHDEDEVRFIIKGRGIFHISPEEGDVVSIEMHPGDMICVPKGTQHWFDLCEDRTVRAIRLFQDPAGWKPFYTESGKDLKYRTA